MRQSVAACNAPLAAPSNAHASLPSCFHNGILIITAYQHCVCSFAPLRIIPHDALHQVGQRTAPAANALHMAGRRYRMLIFSTRPHTTVCPVYLRWQTARIGPKSRPKSRLRKPRKLLLPFSVRIKTKLAPTAAPKLPRGRPSTLDVLFVCDAAVSTATWVFTSPKLSPSRLMIGCLAGLKPSMKMATLA